MFMLPLDEYTIFLIAIIIVIIVVVLVSAVVSTLVRLYRVLDGRVGRQFLRGKTVLVLQRRVYVMFQQ